MASCSFFYQSGMTGQDSFRLPNGEDLPLPSSALWNDRSANIEVDYVNLPPPHRLRIHYRVVITTITGGVGRTRHISEFVGDAANFARDQGLSRTAGRALARYFARHVANRILGAAAVATECSQMGGNTFLRLMDGDRGFTFIIVN